MKIKLCIFLFLFACTSCETHPKENQKSQNIIDNNISIDTFEGDTQHTELQMARLVSVDILPQKIEYECHKQIFSTVIEKDKEEQIFDIDHWMHTLCIQLTFNQIPNIKISINNVDIWDEFKFNNKNPQIKITKIIKLPIPFTQRNGKTGSVLRVQSKGRQESKVTINIYSARPTNIIHSPSVFENVEVLNFDNAKK